MTSCVTKNENEKNDSSNPDNNNFDNNIQYDNTDKDIYASVLSGATEFEDIDISL